MLVGAHIGVSKGYDKAAAYAAEVGCEAVQVFAKSPQQWVGRPVDPAAAARFAAQLREQGVGAFFTHAAYLINLGSKDHGLWSRSLDALADELWRAHVLGAAGAVTHIGTAYDAHDLRKSARRVAEAVALAIELSGVPRGGVRVILENTAGAGTTFGRSFDELGAILADLERAGFDVGVCIDTCHAWAAGMDVSSADGWKTLLDGIDACCGKDRIAVIHANDCKFGRGKNKDRHEWIGDGKIGYSGFRAMLCEPRLAHVPAIIEMPGDPPRKDAENIARLKLLRSECG